MSKTRHYVLAYWCTLRQVSFQSKCYYLEVHGLYHLTTNNQIFFSGRNNFRPRLCLLALKWALKGFVLRVS